MTGKGTEDSARGSDLSYGFFIARKSGERGLWLGLMLSGEEFESAPLLREVCDHLRFSLQDE